MGRRAGSGADVLRGLGDVAAPALEGVQGRADVLAAEGEVGLDVAREALHVLVRGDRPHRVEAAACPVEVGAHLHGIGHPGPAAAGAGALVNRTTVVEKEAAPAGVRIMYITWSLTPRLF